MLTVADAHLKAIERRHNKHLKTLYENNKELAISFTRISDFKSFKLIINN